MRNKRIVLDTNALVASLSRRGQYYAVWNGLQEGKYTLCISNEILDEYIEIIGRLMTPSIAENVADLLLKSENVELIHPHFRLGIITADPDDNKFVDCAFAANATYIVSDDTHYEILNTIDFPMLFVIKLKQFLNILQSNN
ncbi:MAG: putative toxin-antitoxin system toxin component, PIN family [Bacteroidales bacterium]|nr:putative toxin-antitoxin system toxin component, PIN family [Bacteroidales bacterium]